MRGLLDLRSDSLTVQVCLTQVVTAVVIVLSRQVHVVFVAAHDEFAIALSRQRSCYDVRHSVRLQMVLLQERTHPTSGYPSQC
jgi:hypothetical protein